MTLPTAPAAPSFYAALFLRRISAPTPRRRPLDALAGWTQTIELPLPKDAALRPAIKLLKSARKHESDACRNAASNALACFGPR